MLNVVLPAFYVLKHFSTSHGLYWDMTDWIFNTVLQIIIFMAIAKGKSRIKCGQLSLHTETAIHITELLTKVSLLKQFKCPSRVTKNDCIWLIHVFTSNSLTEQSLNQNYLKPMANFVEGNCHHNHVCMSAFSCKHNGHVMFQVITLE